MKMDLLTTDEGHSNIAFTGFYELELSREISRQAQEGGLMVDVGANYGYFSLLWAGAKPGNRVVAFEASPRNFPALSLNREKNGLAAQIDLRPYALGRQSGSLRFDPGPTEESGWGGFTSSERAGSVEVPVQTLDESLPADVRVNVLKIDVEGADTWVLYGAERLLREQRIEHIYFEQNKYRMNELGIRQEEAIDYLKSMGYETIASSCYDNEVMEYHAFPMSRGPVSTVKS